MRLGTAYGFALLGVLVQGGSIYSLDRLAEMFALAFGGF